MQNFEVGQVKNLDMSIPGFVVFTVRKITAKYWEKTITQGSKGSFPNTGSPIVTVHFKK